MAGLILTRSRGLRQDMAQMESRLDKRISGLESQIGELRERMAHLEGLLEGSRDASGRRAKPSQGWGWTVAARGITFPGKRGS